MIGTRNRGRRTVRRRRQTDRDTPTRAQVKRAGIYRRFAAWWWKHRRELAPTSTGLAVLVLVAGEGDSWSSWWPVVLMAGLGATAAAWRLQEARSSSYQPVSGPGAYIAIAGVVASAWLAFAWALGLTDPILAAWLAVVGAAQARWSWDRRIRTKVITGRPLRKRLAGLFRLSRAKRRPLEEVIKCWPSIVEGTRAGKSRVMRAEETEHGYRLRIGHVSAESLVAIAGHLATELRTRRGGIHVRPIAAHADQAWLDVNHDDPLAAVRRCPDLGGERSISDDMELGIGADGQPVLLNLLPKVGEPLYLLLAGQMGSGKSSVLHVITRSLVRCRDAVLWVGDLKFGLEFGPWKPCLGRLETDVSGVGAMLRDLQAVMEARGRQLAGTGRAWVPSPEMPALVVLIDEFADLDAATMALLFEVARKGRALGLILILATQRPSESALGADGSNVRSQFPGQVALRLRAGDEALIFGPGMLPAGWSTSGFEAPGCLLICSPQHQEPRPARAYFVSDADISADVTRWSGSRPGLDRPSAVAAGMVPPVDHDDDGQQEAPRPSLSAPRWRRVSVAEYGREIGLKRTMTVGRLEAMAAAGKARKVGRGWWEIEDGNQPRLTVLRP